MGLPYVGNKRAIAKPLICFLKKSFPDIENFYDLFGGGGTISEHACGTFNNVHYNELIPEVFHAVKSLHDGRFLKLLPREQFINRELFFEIKNSKPETDDDFARKGLVSAVFSFGNNLKDYIYGEKIEEWKHTLHDMCFSENKNEIIQCLDFFEKRIFLNKEKKEYNIFFDKNCAEKILAIEKGSQRRFFLKKCINKTVCDPERDTYQYLERLQSLEKLERLDLMHKTCSNYTINYTNNSYEKVVVKEDSLIYCDIPYDTKSTKNLYRGKPNSFHKDFYKWALWQKNPVIFSSYEGLVPKEFKIIFKIKKRNLLQGGSYAVKGTECVEVLAWNGVGNIQSTNLFD